MVAYSLQSLTTGKHYIGISVDPAKRFRSHSSKPPAQIKKCPIDAYDPSRPLRSQFKLTVFPDPPVTTALERHQLESKYIAQFNSLAPNGYNIMNGDPIRNRRYWAMQKSKKRKEKNNHAVNIDLTTADDDVIDLTS